MKVGCEGHCGVDLIISKVDFVGGVTIASFLDEGLFGGVGRGF